MGLIRHILFILVILCLFSGCEKRANKRFTKLAENHTHISFVNEIIETKELNVMQYEYLYNGGGVGIGDFNGDTLPDIYFTGNMVPNKLYLNQGNFQFKDITFESGVAGKDAWSAGVSIVDVNGDGRLDIYACYSGLGEKKDRSNQLYINQGLNDQGIPTFVDKAKEFGVDAPGTYTTQAAFFDYDLDGDLDLFLLNHSKTFFSPFFNSEKLRNSRHPYFGNRLYRNDMEYSPLEGPPAEEAGGQRGVFKDVSEEAGIHGSGLNYGLGIAVSDFNQDGYPDIYVSNDYEEQDFLYINLKNGKFEDCSHQSMGHQTKSSMGNDAADLNNDGWVDLMTLDMIPEDNYRRKILKGPITDFDRYQLAVDSGFHHQHMRNMLHYNRGLDENGQPVFSEIGYYSSVYGTDWSWSVLMADYDNDSHKDLFITNGYLKDFTNMDFIKFHLVEAMKREQFKGKELFSDQGKVENQELIFELLQKIPASKISNYAFRNEGNFQFNNVTSDWGLDDLTISTGAAYADLDLDGDLDLVVALTNEAPAIYRNETGVSNSKNSVQVRLHGNTGNTYAIGAKVRLETELGVQYVENYPVRGYQSSVDPILHFGLGGQEVKTIQITWPDGSVAVDDRPLSGAILHYYQKDAIQADSRQDKTINTSSGIFKDISETGTVRYRHIENDFTEFRVDPLALTDHAKSGPRMSVADANDDGFDDVFVGGASGQPDVLFLSQTNGSYLKSEQPAFEMNKLCETTSSVFFDADGDGDQDIYTVSGGADFRMGSKELKDVLYINDGKGFYSQAKEGIIPVEYSNGNSITAGDFDGDGDADLFIGGGVLSGSYPLNSPGGILINHTAEGDFRFSVGTDQVNPVLRDPGILHDASWVDINNDDFPDLILAGEWMPIRVFINEGGKKLVEKTEEMGLAKTYGFWQRVECADIDNDGDIDIVAGNIGKNIPFRASKEQPMELYSIDFHDNGKITPVITSYVQGKSYPIASLNEILMVLPDLEKKFNTYESYANATVKDMFSEEILARSKVYHVNMLESMVSKNNGQGAFELEVLPEEAQYSSPQGIVVHDFTGDNVADILLTGNLFSCRVEYGPVDASIGTLLIGEGNGQFRTASQKELGVWIRGDVRDAKLLMASNSQQIIVSKNSGDIQVLQMPRSVLPPRSVRGQTLEGLLIPRPVP